MIKQTQFKRLGFIFLRFLLKMIPAILLVVVSTYQTIAQTCSVNAGVDAKVCPNSDNFAPVLNTFQLSGNQSSINTVSNTIRWRIVSQPSGANVNINSPTSLSTTVGGTVVIGEYTFSLEVECTDGVTTIDYVTYTVGTEPTDPIIYSQNLGCYTGSPLEIEINTLAANERVSSFYVNSGIDGTLTKFDHNTYLFTPEPLTSDCYGDNGYSSTFNFTISNDDDCEKRIYHTVHYNYAPGSVYANAVPDIVCGSTELFAACSLNGGGQWTYTGPGSVSFSNGSTNPRTWVSTNTPGNYTFTWTVSGGCRSGSASVPVTFVNCSGTCTVAAAYAGENKEYCGSFPSSFTMEASYLETGQTGEWRQINGTPVTIGNINDPNTVVKGITTGGGPYEFIWLTYGNGCLDRDTVVFTELPEMIVNIQSTIGCNEGIGYFPAEFTLFEAKNYPLNSFYAQENLEITVLINQVPATAVNDDGTFIQSIRPYWLSNKNGWISANDVPSGTVTVGIPYTFTISMEDYLIGEEFRESSYFNDLANLTISFSPYDYPVGFYDITTTVKDQCGIYTYNAQNEISVMGGFQATAGTDIVLNCMVYETTLAGVGLSLSSNHIGQWTMLSGPGPSPLTETSQYEKNPYLSNLSAGVYEFRYFRNLPVSECEPEFDDVIVLVPGSNASTNTAVVDQGVACSGGPAVLIADYQWALSGTWRQVSPSITTEVWNSSGVLGKDTLTVTGLRPNTTYTYAFTSANDCGSDVSQVTFTTNSSQGPSLADIQEEVICLGATTSYSLSAASISSGTGNWSIISQPSGANARFSSSSNPNTILSNLVVDGIYEIRWRVSTSSCSVPSEDFAKVVVGETDIPNAGDNREFCDVSIPYTMTLNANSIASPSQGQWIFLAGPTIPIFSNPASSTSTVTFTQYGKYAIAWQSSIGAGCDVLLDPIEIEIGQGAPTANAGPNQNLCGTSNTTNLNALDLPSGGRGTWVITNLTGSVAADIAVPSDPNSAVSLTGVGRVSLTWITQATSSICPTKTDEMYIDFFGANAGEDIVRCNVSTITLEGGDVSVLAGASASWSLVSGPNTPTIASPTNATTAVSNLVEGTYIFRYTASNGSGCTHSDEVTVTIRCGPICQPTSTGVVCAGSTISLNEIGGDATSWSWSGPNGFSSNSKNPTISSNATTAMTGTYTLTVSDGSGDSNTCDVDITVHANPTTTAIVEDPSCSGIVANNDGRITLSGYTTERYDLVTGSSYSGNATYSSASFIPTGGVIASGLTNPTGSRDYTIRIFNNDCYIDRTVTLNETNCGPVCTTTYSGAVCEGGTISLSEIGNEAVSWSWSGPNSFSSNSKSPTISNNATAAMSGIYTVTISDGVNPNTCSVNVTVHANPIASNTTIIACSTEGGSANFELTDGNSSIVGGQSGMTVTYHATTSQAQSNTNALNSPYTASNGTTIYARVTTSEGCYNTTPVTLSVVTPPTANAGINEENCVGVGTNLSASGTGGSGGYTYIWNNTSSLSNANIANPIANPLTTTTYTVTITDSNGCTDTDQVTVNVIDVPAASCSLLPPYNSTVLDTTIFGGTELGSGWTTGGTVSNDNNYTSSFISPDNSPSPSLDISGQNWNLPAGTTIQGIEVTIRKSEGGTSSKKLVRDFTIQLLNGNNNVGNNLAKTNEDWSTSEQVSVYGGPTDLWGYNWDDRNIANLGLRFQAEVYGNGKSNETETVRIDQVQIKVFYTPPIEICGGDQLAVSTSAFADNYTWTIDGGGTISSGQGTSSASFIFPSEGIYKVCVTAENECGTSDPCCFNLAGKLCYEICGSGSDEDGDGLIDCQDSDCAPVVELVLDNNETCVDETSLVLSGGTPANGTYSGTGVSGTSFNPSVAGVGTHTITYTYTNAGGCTRSATGTITVYALPTVTLSLPDTDACVSETSVSLSGGSPAGGTYSFNGTTITTFDASTAGVGTHLITYTYQDGNGCENTATDDIIVRDLPTVSVSFPDRRKCIKQPSFALSGGSPTNGTYSGPGVNNGNFDPSAAGVGDHTITYTYTDGNSCTNSATTTLTVYAEPTISLSVGSASSCISETSVSLTGSPANGSYSGTGVTGNTFNPSAAGVGTHTITYSYTDGGGCSNSTTEDITVHALPTVSVTLPDTDVCVSETSVSFSGGSPTGGSYSFNGTTITTFDPSTAGVGTHTITYTYTDGNGCENTATDEIVVRALPSVSFNLPATQACVQLSSFTLSGGSPSNGTYSGTAVNGTTFDPSAAGLGDHVITYTYTDGNGCSNTATQTITVYAATTVSLTLPTTTACVAQTSITLGGGSPANGTYSGIGVTGTTFDPSAAGVGTHTITYTYADANGCGNSATASIEVGSIPTAYSTITGAAEVCIGASQTYSITAIATADSYTWSVPSDWTISAGQGTNRITVIGGSAAGDICVTASNSCGDNSQECLGVSPIEIPVQPGLIIGSEDACENTTAISYSIDPVAEADSYTWSVPSGWSVTNNGSTNSILVSSGTTGGTICVRANNTCGASIDRCMSVSVTNVPATSSCSIDVPTAPSSTTATGSASNITSQDCGDRTNWNNTGNISIADNSYTTTTLGKNDEGDCLRIQGLGFNIPQGSIIEGIEIKVEGYQQGDYVLGDNVVRLLSATGTEMGVNKANNPSTGTVWGTTENSWAYGGSSDLWGTNLSLSDINDPDFGLSIQLRNGSGSGNSSTTAYLDQVEVIVHYLPPAKICAGENLSTAPVAGATTYTWSVVSGGTVREGQGTLNANFTFSGPNLYQICVTAGNDCGIAATCCRWIEVEYCVEICTNGIDDDGDGLVDCEDPDCGGLSITEVVSSEPDNCPALTNGSITITAVGNNLAYSINNGRSYQTSNIFNNLENGSYNILIRNSVKGCQIAYLNNPVVISDPVCVEICGNDIDDDGNGVADCDDVVCGRPNIVSVQKADPDNCPALTNGSITITATGDSLRYSIDGGLNFVTTNVFADLLDGDYTIHVKNNETGCTAIYGSSITLTDPVCVEICGNDKDDDGNGVADCDDAVCGTPTITDVASASPANCPVLDDGQITISATVGTGDTLEYSIDNGSSYQLDSTFTNLIAGDYTILVRNKESGCEVTYASNPVTLSDPACIEICGNELDDDGDGKIDYQDEDCGDSWPEVAHPVGLWLCDGTNYTFGVPAALPGFTYYWDFGVHASQANASGIGPHVIQFSTPDAETPVYPKVIFVATHSAYEVRDTYDLQVRPIPTITGETITAPSNCGANNAGLEVSITKATGSCIQISLNGGVDWQASDKVNFTGLASGSYNVKIKYCDDSCESTYGIVNISDPDPSSSLGQDLFTNICPGQDYKNTVSNNDTTATNTIFNLENQADFGTVVMQSDGAFSYTPDTTFCGTDQFSYTVCLENSSCCVSSTVTLNFEDTTDPVLQNVPADITVSCDEEIPLPPLITAFDNCPAITIDKEEVSTQGLDECSQYSYTITRTWTATDICGNSTTAEQKIEVQDNTAPDIFRIYTLPNGRKMIAGVMENVYEEWKTVSFPIQFVRQPLVFTQVVTSREDTPVAVRLRNVSTNQFEMKLQEEAGQDGKHIRESIAWIAIEPGSQTEDYILEAGKIEATEAWSNINFPTAFGDIPAVFTSMQTIKDTETSTGILQNISSTGVEVAIEEESSQDSDLGHIAEELAYFALGQTDSLTDARGDIIGEVGTIEVDQNQTRIITQNEYYNPIVIAQVVSDNESDPITVRVQHLRAGSFDIQVQEWEYLDGMHNSETVAYMVIEGSLPLNTERICEYGTDSLVIGEDIIAVDNCDANITIQYDEREAILNANKELIRTWYAEDACGNTTTYTQTVTCQGVALRLRGYLQGALVNVDGTDLMRDDLRKLGYLPTTEPYTDLPNFMHVGDGGGETVSQELLEVTGPDAIVDWVFIELKSGENFEDVVATSSGLLQRDGDVISSTGEALISFHNIDHGEYYIEMRHRNHLAVETMFPYIFTATSVPEIDFSWEFQPTRGQNPLTFINKKIALWSGDLNGDNLTIFQGPNNDVFYMFLKILTDEANKNNLTNFISSGYTNRDFNMDGQVIFQGPGNDRSILLWNTVFNHPENPQNRSNFVVSTKENVKDSDYNECANDDSFSFCDHDRDGILNGEDPDDDNDGVADGNDIDPYDKNSDSDLDGLSDDFETGGDGIYHAGTDSDPLSACDPSQTTTACQASDEDGDGFIGNYPVDHEQYDPNDMNACEPDGSAATCQCPDADGDGYIFVCNMASFIGGPQTVSIAVEDWEAQQAGGSYCGPCQEAVTTDCEAGVSILRSKTVTAKGAGTKGVPKLRNLTIPKGQNRMLLVLASFEREHCNDPQFCSASNTSGEGLGTNYATDETSEYSGNTIVRINARFTSPSGSIDKRNRLANPYSHAVKQYVQPPTAAPGKAYLSRETYPILLNESDIQALLGGTQSGQIDISLPNIQLPQNDADDAILTAVVFENVAQDSTGAILTGWAYKSMDNNHPANYQMAIDNIGAGQELTQVKQGLILFGMSGRCEGFQTSAGFEEIERGMILNDNGAYTALNEGDGFSTSVQFRNGTGTNALNQISLQAAGNAADESNGGMVFTILLNPCDNPGATATPPVGYIDNDNDGYYANVYSTNSTFDPDDANACIPNPDNSNGTCTGVATNGACDDVFSDSTFTFIPSVRLGTNQWLENVDSVSAMIGETVHLTWGYESTSWNFSPSDVTVRWLHPSGSVVGTGDILKLFDITTSDAGTYMIELNSESGCQFLHPYQLTVN